MGISTGRDLHIDQNLTNVAMNYRPTGMIADMIAPIVNVQKESDLYPVFSQKEAFAIEDTKRSRGALANRITRSVSSEGYKAENYALAYDLPIEDRANMDAAYAFELESGAARYVVDKLWLDWDRRVLSTVGSTSNVSTGFVPSSAWNAASNPGDPVSALYQVIEQVQATTAYRPNRLLFGWQAYNLFRRNSNVRNFVLGTNNGGGVITRQAVAGIFEVEQVLVAEAFYNSANEAKAISLANTFPKDAVLAYYCPSGPSREVPSFMYSFRWTAPGLPAPLAVERHPYDSKRKVESIEAGYYQDEKITSSALGALLVGVGSAQSNGLT
jgi:hypothetical protein